MKKTAIYLLTVIAIIILSILIWKSPRSSEHVDNPFIIGEREFLRIALETAPNGQPTDKVVGHLYQIMYGIFLIPLVNDFKTQNRKLKLLEIGMGCDMFYGPGKSVALWKKLLGNSGIIYEAEYNATCVNEAIKKKQLGGVHGLVGDQGDRNVLNEWVKSSDGNFDVIIDDGGHGNMQIYNSFDVLFHKGLAHGGLYFIEDLHVGRHHTNESVAMTDIIQAWIEQLLIPSFLNDKRFDNDKRSEMNKKYPIPSAIKWIFCQYESCVIAKCEFKDSSKCKPLYF